MKTIKLIFLLLAFCLAASAQDSKISDLASATQSLNDADLFVVVQSATTKKYTFDNLQEDVFEGTDFTVQQTGANESIFLGENAGISWASGVANIGIGRAVMDVINGGNYNVGIGNTVLKNISTATGNTSVGAFSMSNNPSTCNYNTAVGYFALQDVTTGANSTAVGADAGRAILTTTGTFVGYRSGYLTTGDGNSFFGESSGDANVGGQGNDGFGEGVLGANTEGDNNAAFGGAALGTNTTGSKNTALGFGAGNSTSQTGCIYLGYQAGQSNSTNNLLYIENSSSLTDVLILGDFAGNEVIINGQASDNANSYNFFVEGTAGGLSVWTNDSDSTLKKDVSTITGALDKVMNLRGVTFDWKDNRESERQIGFIAQEVNRVIPELVVGESGTMAIKTAAVTAVLVEAMQEQQAQIVDLQYYVKTLLSFIIILFVIALIFIIKWRNRTGKILIESGESS